MIEILVCILTGMYFKYFPSFYQRLKDFILPKEEWGYTTTRRKRFKVGEVRRVSKHKISNRLTVGQRVTIIENGRHDYLIEYSKGLYEIVYQDELR